MTKKTAQSKKAKFNQKQIIAAALLALVVIVGAVLLFSQQTAAPASAGGQLLQPEQYVNEFTGKQHFLLDVRTPEEFASGHIAGAVNINVEELSSRLSEVPKDQPVVVYCRSGNRSRTASNLLSSAGYSPVYDLGGIIAWQAAGLPVE